MGVEETASAGDEEESKPWFCSGSAPSVSTLSPLNSVKKPKGTWDTEAVEWVKGTVSGEVVGAVSVLEGMVKPADTLSRDAKEMKDGSAPTYHPHLS